ncbi:alpha/beta hydrolase fold domain-containing protein [Kocuria sp. cx-116]|uniref:alpha/beta hydrolase fold domain-containing protein n=1 Tax=Kocuria sp. cx-116 TaxID=2771378 RepID=UPI002A4E2A64|nr:alpha/beta hydrolase fold domain-containing protein [Kocuria sp. cx-116]
MTVPLWLADTIAKLMQKGPGAPRMAPEVTFYEVPATTTEITIPTRHGEIPATRYSPPDGAEAGVYVNLHGGGFVIGHPEQDDPICRFIAANANVNVLNIDYATAPQLRFPGPVEQAYDVAVWAAAPDRAWNGDLLAIGGQSAGGALAAGAARLAFENEAPRIAAQVLMYPALDLSVPAKAKKKPGKESFLARMGPIFDTVYCPDEKLRVDRFISPAGEHDTVSLAGIAPALVISCERDILQDEAERYATRLRATGSLIEHLELPDVGHGFNMLGAPREVVLPVYRRIADVVSQALDSK